MNNARHGNAGLKCSPDWNLPATKDQYSAYTSFALPWHMKVPDHGHGQDENSCVYRRIDSSKGDEGGREFDARSTNRVPRSAHGCALEHCREKSGDGPTNKNSEDSVQGIPKASIVGRKDATIQEKDRNLGSGSADRVYSLKHVCRSTKLLGTQYTSPYNVSSQTIVSTFRKVSAPCSTY